MPRIHVPTINTSTRDYDKLFDMVSHARDCHGNVIFDFSQCTFLQQNGVSILGGLIRLLQHQKTIVSIDTSTIQNNIKQSLLKNGFLNSLGFAPPQPWSGTSIPYREDLNILSSKNIISHLQNFWLGQRRVHMSEALCSAIISTIWEIYANAFEHSQSPVGVFTCGQYYPKTKELKLAVADFGEGIPNIVRKHVNKFDIAAKDALQWAFRRGTTTAKSNFSRGLGLDLLKSFVRVNAGRLEVFSNEGCVTVDADSERYSHHSTSFRGTILSVTLKSDNKYYKLSTEPLTAPLF